MTLLRRISVAFVCHNGPAIRQSGEIIR